MRRAVLMTRQAISPRLAMRILSNICAPADLRKRGRLSAPHLTPSLIGALGARPYA
jgi:hypothetical protein